MMDDGHLLDRGKINQVLCLTKISYGWKLSRFDFLALLVFFCTKSGTTLMDEGLLLDSGVLCLSEV